MSLGLSAYVGGCYVGGDVFKLDAPETIVLSFLAAAMVLGGIAFLKYKLNQCCDSADDSAGYAPLGLKGSLNAV